eukprot:TRINITY_DN2467_c0_g1_i1.p1 TRINITY_DN2467_c0_g1~~TRINITY_DN2467_c0_g1_i1.p1  ORF type:complete len:358 (+),score=109.24 TRINITY_DN2467_c0_g1_i1:89-1162(+)
MKNKKPKKFYPAVIEKDFIKCPYNSLHLVPESRLQWHILKCPTKAKNGHLYSKCPYNALHIMIKEEFNNHIRKCPDRHRMENYFTDEESIAIDNKIKRYIAARKGKKKTMRRGEWQPNASYAIGGVPIDQADSNTYRIETPIWKMSELIKSINDIEDESNKETIITDNKKYREIDNEKIGIKGNDLDVVWIDDNEGKDNCDEIGLPPGLKLEYNNNNEDKNNKNTIINNNRWDNRNNNDRNNQNDNSRNSNNNKNNNNKYDNNKRNNNRNNNRYDNCKNKNRNSNNNNSRDNKKNNSSKNEMNQDQTNKKRIRNLKKKLKEIKTLESRLSNGEKLNQAQIAKINRKKEISEELASLS